MRAPAFGAIDWAILVAYLLTVLAVGALVARRRAKGDDFFLAGRAMPVWAVSVSVLATALSAATFVGGPQQSYASDLTYLSSNIGGLLAVIVVATIFVPAFYRHRVTSVYEVIGHECGTPARLAASAMFMVGRVFASGARLFMVALPFSLVVFGDVEPSSLYASIVVIATVAALYTALGGIRAVIWTDVLQAAVLVGTVAAALLILWAKIPADFGEIMTALSDDDGVNKVRLLDLSTDPSRPFTLWTALFGFTLFSVAAYGTDQDLAQRLLTCRSARSGAWSIILSNIISWPVVLLFLLLGLLLFVYYQRPDVMGAAAPGYQPDDTRKVFLEFMLHELPRGMPGLMMAGLFAAAMSSTDSALNAMASTTIADFYRPWRRRREPEATDGDRREVRASRLAVAAWALALAAFACVCVRWQQASGETLITFALGVMVYAYGGLLGVFLTVLLTRRGNAISAVAALLVGFAAVVAMEPRVWSRWAPHVGLDFVLAFPWKMLVATTLSFTVCLLGTRRA
ncbi:MAG: sodium/solute symporter [Planctomycetes bacterium]|nr:sodium/solute symporter [Planctomycetota bacterium]